MVNSCNQIERELNKSSFLFSLGNTHKNNKQKISGPSVLVRLQFYRLPYNYQYVPPSNNCRNRTTCLRFEFSPVEMRRSSF